MRSTVYGAGVPDDSAPTLPPSSSPLSISQAAERCGVSADTLRYYEREGLRFLLVLRGTGMGMAGLREYVALVEQGTATVAARREKLVAHEQHVLAQQRQLEEHLQAIRHKIRRYDTECGCGTRGTP